MAHVSFLHRSKLEEGWRGRGGAYRFFFLLLALGHGPRIPFETEHEGVGGKLKFHASTDMVDGPCELVFVSLRVLLVVGDLEGRRK